MDTPADSVASQNNGTHHQHVRLACQACQRKKIKCDRTVPCGQCQRSSLQCLPSSRKPRARYSTAPRRGDTELRSRISKLESLVESLSGEATPDSISSNSAALETPTLAQDIPPTVGKYISSPFWANLITEVQSLRDVLGDDASDEELDGEPPATAKSTTTAPPAQPDILICSPSSIFLMPGALPDPDPQVVRQLDDIFLHNVDSVFKVLHRPTIQRLLDNNDSYLGFAADSPPVRALRATMWFAAVTTLSDADCLLRFPLMPRSELLPLYRRHVDVALAQADLLSTQDLPTLQALVLYTAASRITDQSRRPWTMTGLMIRIACGMNLHKESTQNDSPYMKETKRRLWHQIRVLDAFSGVDRGTPITIGADTFDTPPPSNVNDIEYDESSTFIPDREEGLTDITFGLMAHAASSLSMKLLTPETTEVKDGTWQQRLDMALNFGKTLRQRYLQYCDLSNTLHRFIYAVGNSMAASSVLRAVRPMHRHVSSVPPRVDSPFVLQLAVNSLRESESTHQDPEAEGWRWIFWAQWHALAVALAGLCSIRGTELADTAWIYVEKSYERHSQHIADTRGGMLWKPIERLYKTAGAFRDGAAARKSADHDPPNARLSQLDIGAHAPASMPATDEPNDQAMLPLPDGPVETTMLQPMDFTLDADLAGLSPLQVGDMTWMDFERIMEDITSLDPDPLIGIDAGLGAMQDPALLQTDWPDTSNQNV